MCLPHRRQPYVKLLSGLLRGGTTISDARGAFAPGIQTHDDIGAAGYSSIVFAHSGVTKPVATGECAQQDIHKKLALSRVEAERLSRAKFLEERKGNQVRLTLPPVLQLSGVSPAQSRTPSAHAGNSVRASILSTHAGNCGRQSKCEKSSWTRPTARSTITRMKPSRRHRLCPKIS